MDDHYRRRTLEGSWEWLKYASQLPARPVPLLASTGTVVAFSGRCLYMGINALNTATTAGRVVVYDGLDASGPIVDASNVAASGLASVNTVAGGVLCEIGLTVVITTLVITGSVLVVPLWHYENTPPGE